MKVTRETARFLEYETGKIVPKKGKPRVTYPKREEEVLERVFAEREHSKRESDKAFLKDARHYADKSNFKHSFGRANVLAKYYEQFSFGGNQPLINSEGEIARDPGYIGVIFNRVYNGVKKRLKD